MSDLKAKMHQNRLRLGLRPRPGAAYSAPVEPQLDLRGLLLRGEEGRGEVVGENGKEKEEKLGVPALRWYGSPMVNPAC